MINFPNSPTIGQIFTFSGRSWMWNGTVWNVISSANVSWGGITGTLANQTDLQTALNSKANLSGATFTGPVIFNSATTTMSSTAPRIDWVETDASANNGKWRLQANGNVMDWYAYDDAGSVFTSFLTVSRTGTTVNSLAIKTDLTVTNSVTAASFNTTSDERLKIVLENIEDPIGKLKQIGGYKYRWKKDICDSIGFEPENEIEHGVIAQEIEKIFPDMVSEYVLDRNYKTVKYDRLVSFLIEVVKEQQKQIEEIQKKLE